MEKQLHINIPIAKIDEERREVWGVATSEDVDGHNEIVDYEASKKAFGAWPGNIREMHQDVAVGKGIQTQFDDGKKVVMVGAKISESADGENTWQKVKEKILTGFSIGGIVNSIEPEEVQDEAGQKSVVHRIKDYVLTELSLVDNPANPKAELMMVKSIGGKLQRVEVPQRIGDRHPDAWWFKFLQPIETAQPGYNNDEVTPTNGGNMSKDIRKDDDTKADDAATADAPATDDAADAADQSDGNDDSKSDDAADTGGDDADDKAGDDDAPADDDTDSKKSEDGEAADDADAKGDEDGKDEDDDKETDKSAGSKELNTIKKTLDRLEKGETKELTKAIGGLTTVVKDLAGRVEKMEKTAAPSKTKAGFATVTKGEDGDDADDEVKKFKKDQARVEKEGVNADDREVVEIAKRGRKLQLQGKLPVKNDEEEQK